ncbi:MAG: ABC transporter permease [Desulfobacterales bacterium]|nr:ABC transporter permease [Desulfobacterales bacterium]
MFSWLGLRGFGLRLVGLLMSLWGIATIVFFVTRLGGDPAALLLPPGTALADIEAFRKEMGFDRPLPIQYVNYLLDALRGDFGRSFDNGQPAFSVILESLPASLELAAAALLYGIVVGGFAGYVAAVKRGGFIEVLAMSLALVGQAIPKFWLGLMLVLVFAVHWGLLPTGGRGDWQNLILPAVSLGTFAAASIARFLRSSMLKVLDEDYVKTAWSKGISPSAVYSRHVVRNALIPVVTIIGLLVGELIGNAVIIETIFSWPGVGRAILQAIERKDFAVVQAGVLMMSMIFIMANIVVDVLYTVLDPRIRVS